MHVLVRVYVCGTYVRTYAEELFQCKYKESLIKRGPTEKRDHCILSLVVLLILLFFLSYPISYICISVDSLHTILLMCIKRGCSMGRALRYTHTYVLPLTGSI